MRPLLSLVMIVKDESANIAAVLEAALPHVDRWTILDTGSTDGTQDIIREVTAKHDKPGQLFEEPFVDFATSRNRVMDLDAEWSSKEMVAESEGLRSVAIHRAAEFQLMLSADEHLRNGEALRKHLEEHRDTNVDCHFLKLVIDETRMYTPRVFRTGSDWRYEGLVHEVPFNRKNVDAPKVGVPGTFIEHTISDYERRFSNIWERHIPLLQSMLDENPQDERALIFLAQAYETLFPMMEAHERLKYGMEAVSLYMQRLAIPTGIEVERNWVRFHLLDCARMVGLYTEKELLDRALQLQQDDPQRPETALLVARSAMRVWPMPKIYEAAARAAHVAEAADQAMDSSAPVSTSCAWQAHHLAAGVARQLAAKFPDADTGDGITWSDRVRQHVARGVAAGGQWELFQRFTEQPKQEAAQGG